MTGETRKAAAISAEAALDEQTQAARASPVNKALRSDDAKANDGSKRADDCPCTACERCGRTWPPWPRTLGRHPKPASRRHLKTGQ
jgi:hypothetical protein